MPWVTFDLNQFKGRAVREEEYPEYFHKEDAEEAVIEELEKLEELDDEE